MEKGGLGWGMQLGKRDYGAFQRRYSLTNVAAYLSKAELNLKARFLQEIQEVSGRKDM